MYLTMQPGSIRIGKNDSPVQSIRVKKYEKYTFYLIFDDVSKTSCDYMGDKYVVNC